MGGRIPRGVHLVNSPRAGTQQGSASSDGCVGSPFFCSFAGAVLARHGVLWLVVVGNGHIVGIAYSWEPMTSSVV